MEDKFYNLALRFLSYRPRSEKEVRDKLTSRIGRKKVEEVDGKVINLVIEKLKEQKFINDEEFTKWWIESRLRFKPRSLRLIKLELKQKGINSEIIESGIKNQELGSESDLESAKNLIERKINRSRNKFGMTPEKLGRFLASKGFNWDTIKKSIDCVLDKGV